MKILIVASYNSGCFSSFVLEQVHYLEKLGILCDLFNVVGQGVVGYLKNLEPLKIKIKEYKPDIIHAHYGLSGLLANMQRKVPVVTTYHGSDIHSGYKNLFLSRIAMYLSGYNIFVGQSLFDISKYKRKNYIIQSCGLNLSVIKPLESSSARRLLNLDQAKVYILFAGAFSNQVKNAILAKESSRLIGDCELIELKGYTREEVGLLMNACDLMLVTSLRESGPLVVKEAMACNRPIVTTNVGDVKWVIGDTEGCYITSYEAKDCAEKIKKAIKFSDERKHTNGRERIIQLGLDNIKVTEIIAEIYNKIKHQK